MVARTLSISLGRPRSPFFFSLAVSIMICLMFCECFKCIRSLTTVGNSDSACAVHLLQHTRQKLALLPSGLIDDLLGILCSPFCDISLQ
ncbi:hypothetical protein GGI42DRAFT_324524 [Trichoderma sp. SZMC 28013]